MTAATLPDDRPAFEPFALVGLTGILFAVVGGVDLGTQIFPLRLGNPEWEFGTYSSVMDSMPLFLMGLGFLAVFAVARSQWLLLRVLGIIFLLLTLMVLAGAFLYATNIPQVLRVGARSPMQTGIKKAVTKGVLQSAIYPIALLWLGVFALRHSARSRRRGGYA
jgi:hypothetical protein